jgi:hypothetical protein
MTWPFEEGSAGLITNMSAEEHEGPEPVSQADYGPPENEMPAVLPAGVSWHGDGIVVAIPVLLVYTTGTELLILCRARQSEPRSEVPSGTKESMERSQAIGDGLRGLRANGRPVELLRGAHGERGFSYRAWAAFLDGPGAAPADITFSLEWSGTENAEHRVTGISEAAAASEVLWP